MLDANVVEMDWVVKVAVVALDVVAAIVVVDVEEVRRHPGRDTRTLRGLWTFSSIVMRSAKRLLPDLVAQV